MSDSQRKYASRYIVASVTNFQNYWRRWNEIMLFGFKKINKSLS